jgi:hypothetical protein
MRYELVVAASASREAGLVDADCLAVNARDALDLALAGPGRQQRVQGGFRPPDIGGRGNVRFRAGQAGSATV